MKSHFDTMPVDFHGYELLLLRRLQNDPILCAEWLAKLQKKIADDEFDLGVNLYFWKCLILNLGI